ncbi:aryl-sulfate sulfotransferase [Variovorax sp. M-6]|uniref:aryl-sulfate sulfotransferase n=1 Tax=Variovorax sp. M-6 TaxID=3233041 RepID=UPI003F9E2B57
MSLLARWISVSRPGLLPLAALALALSGCGGGGGGSSNNAGAIGAVTLAEAQPPPIVAAVRNGVSPFIAFVDLKLQPPIAGQPTLVHYSVESKPGSVARPVNVNYAMSYLKRRGYASADGATVTVPVFGLYANYANVVHIDLQRPTGSQQDLRVEIPTAAYTDPNGIYDRPNILKSRTAGDSLSFDYFYMKSALGSPVVVDTDGQLRWVVPAKTGSFTSLFHGNRFIVGDGASLRLLRLELDGTTNEAFLSAATDLTNFHHNLDPGKVGLLAEMNAQRNGVAAVESTLAEIDPDAGMVLKQWDLADILSRFMQSHGDDPTSFVRPGVDWFHMNAATYDPSDDTLIVSSRENFVVKIDYASGDLVWILGDPTKYWHGFQSLAARSLTLGAGGLYPIGQHSVSITHDGLLQLFNDGQRSANQPAGAPAGEIRSYSAVSAYAIDAASRTAVEARRFDYGQSIYSAVCSSAYQAPVGASMLISYAVADNATHARLVGLDESQNVAFDFEYATSECNTSWNAQPIPFEAMRFDE